MPGLKQQLKPLILNYRQKKKVSFWLQERDAKINNYLKLNNEAKIQFGTGKNLLKDWLNTDLEAIGDLTYIDLKEPLPFENNTFSFAYLEHCFGYLTYSEALLFLEDLFSKLKPNGVIRIETPDLEKISALINQTDEANAFSQWYASKFNVEVKHVASVNAHVINHYCSQAFSTFLHTKNTLTDILTKVGFIDLAFYSAMETKREAFKNISYHQNIIPEEFNTYETIAVEAVKP